MPKKTRRVPRYEKDSQRAKRESERLKTEQAQGRKVRIQADLTRQAPNNSWVGGRLYYEDLEFICRDCGRKESWTARQQQWWYEVAKGHVFSRAVRCRACRRASRGPVAENDG